MVRSQEGPNALSGTAEVEPPGGGKTGEFLLLHRHTEGIDSQEKEPVPGAG
jgi:hypothetical protein